MVFAGSIHKMIVAVEDFKAAVDEFAFSLHWDDLVMGSFDLTRSAATQPGVVVSVAL